MAEFITVAKVGDVEEGRGAAFEFQGRMVAVFLKDGEYHAIDDMCPHAGASLAEGYVENHEVSCPWHAWRFDIRDGTWCDNRRIKIDAFEVRVAGDEIQIRPKPVES
jgi:nitrite reductase (NADH) small subunit/3-phenylpropionate/trans-cinnamate dioxygenase ferredoxin subunit